jgi:hypothetical protein
MTAIRVNGETWNVPNGFGRAYRAVQAEREKWLAMGRPGTARAMAEDALAAVGYLPRDAAYWPARKQVEAIVWARRLCQQEVAPTGRPAPLHPRPRWLRAEPWKGKRSRDGVIMGWTREPTLIGRRR